MWVPGAPISGVVYERRKRGRRSFSRRRRDWGSFEDDCEVGEEKSRRGVVLKGEKRRKERTEVVERGGIVPIRTSRWERIWM